MNLYKPTDGYITIDGTKMSDIPREDILDEMFFDTPETNVVESHCRRKYCLRK